MDKFLFTDGTTAVKQVQSSEELEMLIESSEQKEKIRIWVFSTNEWITLSAFRKHYPSVIKKQKTVVSSLQKQAEPGYPRRRTHWAKKLSYAIAAIAGVFLVFNFTKIKWETAPPLNAAAARPANMPEMDIDSLITEIEYDRDQTLDRSTKTNLRLRNTWPDRILLQVSAEKETSSAGSRFFNVDVSIDNTTGFHLDQAVVRLMTWKNNKSTVADTLHFNTVRYDKLSARKLDQLYKADSISVDFQSIRAKAFNFCYSADLKNEPGAYNDRWFCKD